MATAAGRPALTVIADLDGTLLPKPCLPTSAGQTPHGGGLFTPPVSHGPAYAPLARLLELGCIVVGSTGSKLETHQRLFWDEMPPEARRGGRVLLSTETGRKLYRGNPEDGSPMEDVAFAAFSAERAPPLDAAVVAELVELGQAGLRRFWADAAQDGSLLDAGGPHAALQRYLGSPDASDPPVTRDNQRYPRVEVRDCAVVFCGVPVEVGRKYFEVPARLADQVDGKPAGRYCFDCIPPGLSKALVIEYLLTTQELACGRAVAIGDQPLGNDEGLTRWHESGGIPFVSVSEKPSMVPPHLAACHVTRLANADASASLLEALADALGRQAPTGPAALSVSLVSDLVQAVNASPASAEGR